VANLATCSGGELIGAGESWSGDALGLERVVAAAREVDAASTALRARFVKDCGRWIAIFELARFAVSIHVKHSTCALLFALTRKADSARQPTRPVRDL